jgi:D-alanine-D-alanine ligase
LTDTSLLPLAADAAGISFDEFVSRMLDLAVAAHSSGASAAP